MKEHDANELLGPADGPAAHSHRVPSCCVESTLNDLAMLL
jgi:hypothetical protein